MPDLRQCPNAAPGRPRAPRAALLLVGAGLASSCHLDKLLRAPDPAEGAQLQSPSSSAVRLAFTVQPATARRGAVISPAVEVTAVDQSGLAVPAFTGAIDVDLANGPEDAELSGTTSRRAVAGRAVFDDLELDAPGRGYRLIARADGLPPATSAPFEVTRREPSVLMPVSGDGQTDTVGAPLAPYVVRVTDDGGEPVSGVGILWVAEGAGGAVNPTVAVTDAAGEARTVHTLGTVTGEYRVTASTPELRDRTVTFTSTAQAGTATHLVFTQQPTDTERQRRISPAVRVTARDQFGNTVTRYDTTVLMDIAAGTGTPGARLDGDRSRMPSDGTATFNDLVIDDVGFGYRLLATSGPLSAISDPFHILLLAAVDGALVGAPLAGARELR